MGQPIAAQTVMLKEDMGRGVLFTKVNLIHFFNLFYLLGIFINITNACRPNCAIHDGTE